MRGTKAKRVRKSLTNLVAPGYHTLSTGQVKSVKRCIYQRAKGRRNVHKEKLI